MSYGLTSSGPPSPVRAAGPAPVRRAKTQQPRINADGSIRLNARQRRTLRRAQERALRALVEAQRSAHGGSLVQAASRVLQAEGLSWSEAQSYRLFSGAVPRAATAPQHGAAAVDPAAAAATYQQLRHEAAALISPAAAAFAGDAVAGPSGLQAAHFACVPQHASPPRAVYGLGAPPQAFAAHAEALSAAQAWGLAGPRPEAPGVGMPYPAWPQAPTRQSPPRVGGRPAGVIPRSYGGQPGQRAASRFAPQHD